MFRIWVISSFLPGDTKTSFETRVANWLLARGSGVPLGRLPRDADNFGGVTRGEAGHLPRQHPAGVGCPSQLGTPQRAHCREQPRVTRAQELSDSVCPLTDTSLFSTTSSLGFGTEGNKQLVR